MFLPGKASPFFMLSAELLSFVKFRDIISDRLDEIGRLFVRIFLAPTDGTAAKVGEEFVVDQYPEIDRQAIFVLFFGGDDLPAIMSIFEVQG